MSLAIDSDATLVAGCPPCRRADDDAEAQPMRRSGAGGPRRRRCRGAADAEERRRWTPPTTMQRLLEWLADDELAQSGLVGQAPGGDAVGDDLTQLVGP